MGKHNKLGRKKKLKENELHEKVERIEDAFNFIERRQITVKNAEDLPQLGSIYLAQMIEYSKKSDPEFDIDDYDANEDRPNRLLKLPDDGSIFNDGIPFHHFALTNLKEKHIKRLKKNGIDLRKGQFSTAEDNLLRENWASYATKHDLNDEDAAEFMGAAAATESNDEHRQRIRFIHQTLFRPWMCSKLLDRSAIQVFRRCYHLFLVSSRIKNDLREWSAEDDKRLLQLVEKYGRKWEYIGNELLHLRYSCYRRYEKLVAKDENEEWNQIEIARLYDYLCDHLPRNPVIIALIPKYENLDSHINWEDIRMKLPRRSADARKNKWQELKQDLRATRERIQSDSVKEILRAVFPNDQHLLAKASFKKRKKMKCDKMAEYIDILREFCILNKVDKVREIRPELVEKILNTKGLSDSDFPASHFLRIAKYMLFLGHRIQIFKILPVNQDTLLVRLEMFSFILRNIKRFKVKKKQTRKLAREFVRMKSWEMRDSFVFVERRQKEKEEYEETPNKLIHLLMRKKSFHTVKNE